MNVLAGTSYEFQKYNNFELASLWDVTDHKKINRHFEVMEAYARSIRISKALGNWISFNRLRDEKFKLEQQFDEKLLKFYNDQKSGLSFNDNGVHDFEPHHVVVKKNRVLLRGLSVMLSYFAFETNSTVQGYSIGKGTGIVYPYQEGLEQEVDRVVITEGGKSASGNYLRYSTQFSDALATDIYSEFGLQMFMDGPPALARTVIDELSRRLRHEQGNTFIIGTHYIVFIPQ